MPEYLAGLEPGATLAYVFKDLYDQADLVATELYEARKDAYGEYAEERAVPDTQLELSVAMHRRDRATYCPIVVFAAHPSDSMEQRTPLLSRTQLVSPPAYIPRAESVGAYRAHEISTDYTVAQPTLGGVITCTIGSVGIKRGVAADTRLVGTTAGDPGDRITGLGEEDIQRLRIVTGRIVRSIGIAERMTIGMDLPAAILDTEQSLAA